MRTVLAVALWLATSPAVPDAGVRTGTIDVEIKAKVEHGTFWVALHNDPDAFPNDYKKAFRKVKVKATSVDQHLKLEGIPYGEYAIAVMHDENDNQEVDTNLIGKPTEEYGVSTSGTPDMRPKFEEAKFVVNKKVIKRTVELKRW
jgi:uncharacterized protein (DUF2141 family)